VIIDIFNTTNKYNVIYADPPWEFKTYSDAGKDRSAENHYNVMTLDDLKKLPIKKISNNPAALFMWVTFPQLFTSKPLMEAWGFIYKTCAFNWIKANKSADLSKLNVNKDIRMNLGYYTRANSELCLFADTEEDTDICLLGTTKKVPERMSRSVRQVLITHQRTHSEKPDEIYEKIEELFDGPYLELFARKTRQGWDSWGNQVGVLGEV
jgi:N6-adenosine-specific RNA methylase IME4